MILVVNIPQSRSESLARGLKIRVYSYEGWWGASNWKDSKMLKYISTLVNPHRDRSSLARVVKKLMQP